MAEIQNETRNSLNLSYSLVISPALKVNGGEEEEDAGVGRVLPPQLHAVLLGVLVVPRLVLGVGQLRQPGHRDGDRVDPPIRRHFGGGKFREASLPGGSKALFPFLNGPLGLHSRGRTLLD